MSEMDKTERRTTLLRPPEKDPNRAPIENAVEVTPMKVLGADIFTNTRQPWLPPGARGIYGGCVIAQSLAAAQLTVPDEYLVHSCHCYFLLAGSNTVPILYHVERVRDGRSFVTRTVQARQEGKCIFTTTVSFMREGEGETGAKQVKHSVGLPEGIALPEEKWDEEEIEKEKTDEQDEAVRNGRPYHTRGLHIDRGDDSPPEERRCRQWIRCRGKITAQGGHRAHINALAYLSDNYFIGTVSRIHRLWRWPFKPSQVSQLAPAKQRQFMAVWRAEGLESTDPVEWETQPKVGMQVSLDHSIYFHEPARIKADEWMFTETHSPWSGNGRGLVMQRIFAKDGTLLASCVQEGVVRLRPDGDEWVAKM